MQFKVLFGEIWELQEKFLMFYALLHFPFPSLFGVNHIGHGINHRGNMLTPDLIE